MADTVGHRAERNIVLGAVRNRGNVQVVTALREVMSARPERPSFVEAIKGEARTYGFVFEIWQESTPAEVEQWLGNRSNYTSEDAVVEFVVSVLAGKSRHIGKNTAAALEARFWEEMTKCIEASRDLSYSNGDSHVRLKKQGDSLELRADRAYEFAANIVPASVADFAENHDLVDRDSAEIAVELISRYPLHADLPVKLPQDLQSPDPYGGEPLLYRKTSHGFVVYSRRENRVDDLFVAQDPDVFRRQTVFAKSKDYLDWGLTVAYDALDPLP